MKRDTARALKALDMDLLRAAMALCNLVEQRAKLDKASTEELVAGIVTSLLQEVRGRAHSQEDKQP